jgi:hypothetical protein
MVHQQTILAGAAAALLCACSSGPTPCTTVRDCGVSQRCVAATCRELGDTQGSLGDSCRNTADCASGLICDPAATGFPDGFCTSDCVAGACAGAVCAPISTGPTCAPACTSDQQCRNGYACCASMGNACIPTAACTPAACMRPVVTSSLPPAQVIPLGVHKVGDVVPFDVPAGTGSVTIVHQAKLAGLNITYKGQVLDNSAVPGVITLPSGAKAYDDNDDVPASPDGGVDQSGSYALFAGRTPSTAAFTMPHTAFSLDAGVPAGTWHFSINDYALECFASAANCNDGGTDSDTYDVSVLLRPLPAGTNLDVAFYIVAEVGLTAANAAANPSVQRMVQTFKSLYASSGSGITVRDVTFYDVGAADRARFGTHINADRDGPCDELNQMFTLSGAHPGNVLNLFLVQGISSTDTGGGNVVGIDGTIPGPATLSGTVHSGAAVSLADLFSGAAFCSGGLNVGGCGADKVAYIAAHEAGHFLGLFHTTEQDGRYYDPLTDTAKCPCSSCAGASERAGCATGVSGGQPIFLTAPQCQLPGSGCGGADNLMFWQLASGSQGRLSAQQLAVMRLNPAVQ